MALSPEDRTEVQLLTLLELEKLLHERSGFSEARRAVNKRKQEREAELLDKLDRRDENRWELGPASAEDFGDNE